MSKIYHIGKLPNNDICLPNDVVSRLHADLTVMDDGTYVLTDHSKNGTYVNGRPVSNTSVRVNYGDNIMFANCVPLNWSAIEQSYTGMGGGTMIVDPVPTQTGNNGWAIAGFVCSFLAPGLGLIFSIIGYKRLQEYGDKQRGLAVAGIIISSLMIFFILVYYIFVAVLLSAF